MLLEDIDDDSWDSNPITKPQKKSVQESSRNQEQRNFPYATTEVPVKGTNLYQNKSVRKNSYSAVNRVKTATQRLLVNQKKDLKKSQNVVDNNILASSSLNQKRPLNTAIAIKNARKSPNTSSLNASSLLLTESNSATFVYIGGKRSNSIKSKLLTKPVRRNYNMTRQNNSCRVDTND